MFNTHLIGIQEGERRQNRKKTEINKVEKFPNLVKTESYTQKKLSKSQGE